MKIMILNLPRTTTEEELATEFKAYGNVATCDLVLDKETGTSKGFGFVEMPDVAEAEAAIAALNGKKLNNTNKIRVKPSTPDASQPKP
jgi:RNA recognition motif-containing protein